MTTSAPPSRHARWWMPAWPALGAFFIAALLLSLIAQHAATGAIAAAKAHWTAFASSIATGVVEAVLTGIAFGFVAVAAVHAELGLRRRSYGAKSLTIFLLAVITALLLGTIAVGMSVESHSIHMALRDPMDSRILAVLLFMLVAWPVGHLVGLGYGVASLCRRDERPSLGIIGICCNLLALPVWYVSVLTPSAASSI